MRMIEVLSQTFNVPCRRFSVRLTVAKNERLPLVKEFTMRLLYVLRSSSSRGLQSFFGFSDREMSILMRDLDQAGLIEFEGENVRLTEDAARRFEEGGGEVPHLQDVEDWKERFAVDFISFSLIPYQVRTDNIRLFHEIKAVDDEKKSKAREIAREVFVSSFYEFVDKYKTNISEDERDNLSIYGVSAVDAENSFSFPLTVDLVVDPTAPAKAHHRYGVFDSDAAQENRRALIQEVARGIDKIKKKSILATEWPESLVKEVGDSVFSKRIAAGKVDCRGILEDFCNETVLPYDDGKSVAIAGHFLKGDNLEALLYQMQSAAHEKSSEHQGDNSGITNKIIWQKPSNEFWGRDEETFAGFTRVRREMSSLVGHKSEIVLVGNRNYEDGKELKKRLSRPRGKYAFERGVVVSLREEVACMEAFVVPGMMAGVLVYYLPESEAEVPIPLGFVTRDEVKVKSVSRLLLGHWLGQGRKVWEVWPASEETEVAPQEVFEEMISVLPRSQSRRPRLTLNRR
ncbi:hypothetical protein LRF89_12730 [Halorhodospira sp. 9621]|uniref:hypothetical protein n=1 Tax=Halorhodospira sp. 9621 TaxID=2899135 RepID=UPI001EE8C892|nr:hypothetical protein [Halorhodospira sp. 9621]MCG5534298.1 hypothetical protein [Halorhodospira sp. 9621]